MGIEMADKFPSFVINVCFHGGIGPAYSHLLGNGGHVPGTVDVVRLDDIGAV